MRQYVIDELRPTDHQKIRAYLDHKLGTATFGGIYWVPLAPEILTATQMDHKGCQPFHFALELEPTRLSCELLVRTHAKVRCTCIAYADEAQRNWLIRYMDRIFDELAIQV